SWPRRRTGVGSRAGSTNSADGSSGASAKVGRARAWCGSGAIRSGRETRRASPKGFSLEQGFDPVGQLLHQRAGRGGEAGRAYAWDKAGAPTLIDDRLFGPARYRYDGNGEVAQASFGEGLTERFDYDAAKNVTGVSVEGPEAGADVPAGLVLLWQIAFKVAGRGRPHSTGIAAVVAG
ncbi:hypothetical protein, partial [Streptomyces sp. NPDC014793]|uniref:hypothetical protein n=1 Tax=Streptomyces sp. NPDC014793 TaxID=3364914 RepID=UPI00370D378E